MSLNEFPDLSTYIENGDLPRLKELIKNAQSVDTKNMERNGSHLLHIAIEMNQIAIFDFLLSQKDIDLEKTDCFGYTPLKKAIKCGNYNMTKKLLEAGADVHHSSAKSYPALHMTSENPEIARLLIENGADVNIQCTDKDTVLHLATRCGHLEMVCMLLYYNADANLIGRFEKTPFMIAVEQGLLEIQDVLVNYVTDFDIVNHEGTSLLEAALRTGSPHWQTILEGGATVTDRELCAAYNDRHKFLYLWKNVKWLNDAHFFLSSMMNLTNDEFVQHLEMLMEYDNGFRALVDVSAGFIFDIYIFKNRNLDELYTKYVMVFLMHGCQLHLSDIHKIYFVYGHGELFKMLRYIIDYEDRTQHDDDSGYVMMNLLLNVKYNIENANVPRWKSRIPAYFWDEVARDSEECFKYFAYWPLIEIYLTYFIDDPPYNALEVVKTIPKVPLLIELARNATKRLIVRRFRLKKCSQYYTIVDRLPIPTAHKDILKFDQSLYTLGEKIMNW